MPRPRPHHQQALQAHRAQLAQRLARSLHRRLSPEQLRDLGLGHHVNVDAIAAGDANATTLWQWLGGMLTWFRVAELMGIGQPEMAQQLDLGIRVVERYRATGQITLTPEERTLAQLGAEIQDELAHQVPRQTAIAAADWGETRLHQMQAGMERGN